MTNAPGTWGVAATIKAPVSEVLDFVAYHLDAGAARVFVYLDDANMAARDMLAGMDGVTTKLCDDKWWAKHGQRPDEHRARQSINANHAYRRMRKFATWFAHIDVDEFIWPSQGIDITDVLTRQNDETLSLRLPPVEMLQGDGTAFKARISWNKGAGRQVAQRVYPAYGEFLRGGFIGHTAGKVFVRTGLEGLRIKIHNVFQNGTRSLAETTDPDLILCHAHASSWDQFRSMLAYRMEHGSYRKELPAWDGVSRHELFKTLLEELGDTGLRGLYDEVCLDTPRLRKALEKEGLLRVCPLELEEKRNRIFADRLAQL